MMMELMASRRQDVDSLLIDARDPDGCGYVGEVSYYARTGKLSTLSGDPASLRCSAS